VALIASSSRFGFYHEKKIDQTYGVGWRITDVQLVQGKRQSGPQDTEIDMNSGSIQNGRSIVVAI